MRNKQGKSVKYSTCRCDNIIAVQEAGDIQHSITRETLAAAQLVADGWTAMEAMGMIFLPMFEGWGTKGERGVVTKIFMTRC